MTLLERIGTRALRRLDPEVAHGLALRALHTPLAPLPGPVTSDRLRTTLAGMDLPNPLGLAAGFDKNATAIAPLSRAGFGWIEVGAATPLPQPGNPKPRLFRLSEDAAAINRFGFNNDGMEAIARRLARRTGGIPVGLNLGANKDSANRAEDFARVLAHCAPHIDFATVNVSSPNTEKLRDL
ncbi:MAG: dihydroorotate dehydrogenase (quinone), partial [Pseudomonadota bacterium]